VAGACGRLGVVWGVVVVVRLFGWAGGGVGVGVVGGGWGGWVGWRVVGVGLGVGRGAGGGGVVGVCVGGWGVVGGGGGLTFCRYPPSAKYSRALYPSFSRLPPLFSFPFLRDPKKQLDAHSRPSCSLAFP